MGIPCGLGVIGIPSGLRVKSFEANDVAGKMSNAQIKNAISFFFIFLSSFHELINCA